MQTSSSATTEKHRRAYKACVACRQRKAKCDLGESGQPPCYKCHREQRDCIFEADRQWRAKRQKVNQADQELGYTNANHDAPSEQPIQTPPTAMHETVNSVNISHEDATETSMIRAVVSNGTEALDLLLQGVSHARAKDNGQASRTSPTSTSHHSTLIYTRDSPHSTQQSAISAVLKIWQSSKFVRTGWCTAENALLYMDLFFKNLAPLTPIVTTYYADHANHHKLLVEEPLLCATILMISSRFHTLPIPGGLSRGRFVHEKTWKLCQRLISRLTYGQEFGPLLKVRTLGSIEALLLMSEWHARELYFPPEDDGWDLGLLDNTATGAHGTATQPADWLLHPSEAARRSGRMSWLLLGNALSLSHELKVFSDCDEEDVVRRDPLWPKRKMRIRQLLFIFTNQLSSRLGCGSMLPVNISHSLRSAEADHMHSNHSIRSVEAWIELMKLLRSLCDMVLPSKTYTQQILEDGRYINLLEHFRSLLVTWHRQHIEAKVDDTASYDMLCIEYHYVRVLCNSVGMQAICERFATDNIIMSIPDFAASANSEDKRYHEEVISGGCDLLKKVLELEEKNALRYAPVRVLLRITAGSMFLLKALAMGVRESQLRRALSILDATVIALRQSVLDDVHLSGSFATVLESHVERLRRSAEQSSKRFVPSLPNTQRHSPVPVEPGQASDTGPSVFPNGQPGVDNGPSVFLNGQFDWSNFNGQFGDDIGDGWLDLSSETTLAPLMAGGDLYSWMQI